MQANSFIGLETVIVAITRMKLTSLNRKMGLASQEGIPL